MNSDKRWRGGLTALLVLGICAGANAADPTTTAFQQAYGPYRAALFRTNQADTVAARQAVAQARAAWDQVQREHAQPQVPYAGDPQYGRTLQDVAKAMADAAAAVDAGRLPEAHEHLEAVRDLLAALRQRSQVVVFSDHMNAYHEAMETVLTEGPKLAGQPDGPLALAEWVGTLDHLATRLATQAPAEYQQQPAFREQLQGVQASVQTLRAAVRQGDVEAIRKALGALKGPYSRLFLNFG